MNLKMILTCSLLLSGWVIFSNQSSYAQKGSVAIFQTDATGNFLKRSVLHINRNDLCLGLTTNQISHKSHLEPEDEKSEFIAMARKYHRRDAEINKVSPAVLNYSFSYYTFPKDTTNRLETKEFYLHRSKNQKTAANILVGVGSTMVIVGLIGGMKSYVEGSNTDIYGFIFLAGLLADVVSIPFFISAYDNKKKAATLSFGNQTIYSPSDKSYSQNAVPSLTLRIKL